MSRVLIACEFSGIVRDAYLTRGHDAVSCDLLDTERPGPHHVGSVLDIIDDGWDLMIAHPPCTHLAVSGARWFKDRQVEQAEALEFVQALLDAPIPRIALENPVSVIATRIRPPDCYSQPWEHGHGETKRTCWWLKNLPPLRPSNVVDGRANHVWLHGETKDRWKNRSRTLPGVAEAIADQWDPRRLT